MRLPVRAPSPVGRASQNVALTSSRPVVHAGGGIFAQMCGALVWVPTDVMKEKMQIQTTKQPGYENFWSLPRPSSAPTPSSRRCRRCCCGPLLLLPPSPPPAAAAGTHSAQSAPLVPHTHPTYSSRRRDCHSAAPPSTFIRFFNRDGEGMPAN